jgi:hypothetical protein
MGNLISLDMGLVVLRVTIFDRNERLKEILDQINNSSSGSRKDSLQSDKPQEEEKSNPIPQIPQLELPPHENGKVDHEKNEHYFKDLFLENSKKKRFNSQGNNKEDLEPENLEELIKKRLLTKKYSTFERDRTPFEQDSLFSKQYLCQSEEKPSCKTLDSLGERREMEEEKIERQEEKEEEVKLKREDEENKMLEIEMVERTGEKSREMKDLEEKEIAVDVEMEKEEVEREREAETEHIEVGKGECDTPEKIDRNMNAEVLEGEEVINLKEFEEELSDENEEKHFDEQNGMSVSDKNHNSEDVGDEAPPTPLNLNNQQIPINNLQIEDTNSTTQDQLTSEFKCAFGKEGIDFQAILQQVKPPNNSNQFVDEESSINGFSHELTFYSQTYRGTFYFLQFNVLKSEAVIRFSLFQL